MSGATKATDADATVGVRELKNRLSSYLERANAGEEITVTQHGRPIARITAAGPELNRRQALIDAGVIVPASTSLRKLPGERVALGAGQPVESLAAEQRR